MTETEYDAHMPVLTKDPWFGPKRVLGWGWTPVSPAGWVVTVIAVMLLVVFFKALPRPLALRGTPIGGPPSEGG